MTKAKRALGLVLAVVLIGAALLFFRAPERALADLRQAFADQDAVALDRAVELESLRESLKRQLLALFTAAAPDADTALAVSRFVGTLVDGLVSTEGLLSLAGGQTALEGAQVSWSGPSSFEAVTNGPQGESRWRFERRGLSFVLVAISLPQGLGDELKQQWALRLQREQASPRERALVEENRARACSAWRNRALVALQALIRAQRAYHEEHGVYATSVEALGPREQSGPDLYDYEVVRSDRDSFSLRARGKGVMEGDVLQASQAGIRVVADRCAP